MIDLEDPKNRDKALADFKSLVACPGWHLLLEFAHETIEQGKNNLENGMDNETYEDLRILRANLKSFKTFIDTPNRMIKNLGPVEESPTDENDPY